MKRLTLPATLTACLLTALGTTVAAQSPLCAEFAAPETMPKKYQRLAPVVSGTSTDWILPNDQFRQDYALDNEARHLFGEIVRSFDARGIKLAIMIAPPRPIVAGQDEVNRLSAGTSDFDVAAASASFAQMLDTLRETGAIVPDLQTLATASAEMRDTYYYRHDTHWTPIGAAHSALALASEVAASDIDGFQTLALRAPEVSDTSETFSEKGSLAKVVKATCDVIVAPEVHPIPAFETGGLGLLLDDTARARVVLAGSSFSNRYKSDAYRVGDALAATLEADVENHSVSGGGAIGSLEGVILSGALDKGAPVDLLIWELPYTQSLNSTSMLRQLLGALRADIAEVDGTRIDLSSSGETALDLPKGLPDTLLVHVPEAGLDRMNLEVHFETGKKKTVKLSRKSHVPPHLRTGYWAVSFADVADLGAATVTLRYKGKSLPQGAAVILPN